MAKKQLALIVHNVRSCHNVGSILRTAEGLGIDRVYLTGFSPYPKSDADKRLPHLADKTERQIDKTSLGAHKSLNWSQNEDVGAVIKSLGAEGFKIAALEQTPNSKDITDFFPADKQALVAGNEVEGVDDATLGLCDEAIEITMRGSKESFNVSVASALAVYEIAKKHKML